MPRWVLNCHLCGTEFTHSQIQDSDLRVYDPFAQIDIKPEFPDGGQSLVCPICQRASVYQQYQLIYRTSAQAAG